MKMYAQYGDDAYYRVQKVLPVDVWAYECAALVSAAGSIVLACQAGECCQISDEHED